MLSSYGKSQVFLITVLGLGATIGSAYMGWWIMLGASVLITLGLLAFFRDPNRKTPTLRGQVVSACDGRVSSIHDIEHFEPFDGPARCIRVFLSVFDVHVNRAPLYGRVASVTHKPGKKLNALRPESAEFNESVMIVLENPAGRRPVAAVRQIAGAIARTIVCGVKVGDVLQRGQRYGMIKFGSTTEVYLPHPDRVQVQVRQGQYVYGGTTVIALVQTPEASPAASTSPGASTSAPAES
jgi:phosphatidylserine decarboxylase